MLTISALRYIVAWFTAYSWFTKIDKYCEGCKTQNEHIRTQIRSGSKENTFTCLSMSVFANNNCYLRNYKSLCSTHPARFNVPPNNGGHI